MPIDRKNYPSNWDAISKRIRFERANNRCECTGQCHLHSGRCDAVNYQPHPVTQSRVILTVAHLDQDTWNNEADNLLAMCQRCHLTYDRNYYKDQRLAWVEKLSDADLDVLLSASNSYAVDVIGQYLDSRAKVIWGEEHLESLDDIRTVLQDEWDKRHNPDG